MNTPRVAHILPIALGALLIGTAACGGSGDGETVSSAPTASAVSTASDEGAAEEAESTAATESDTATVCAELQIVRDLSDEVSASVSDILVGVADGTSGTERDTLDAFVALGDDLEAGLPELLAAYERAAAAAASPEVAEEIRAVADGTAALTPALADGFRDAAEAGEFVDLDEVLGDTQLQAASQRAGLASLRLDNFTNPTCGFQFSNG